MSLLKTIFNNNFPPWFFKELKKCIRDEKVAHTQNQTFLNSEECAQSVLEISREDLLEALTQIDANNGSGPDGIPPLFLKECAKRLVEPFYIIFDLSLINDCFSTWMKSSYITSGCRDGNPQDDSRYRPISILSAIPKLFKYLVTKQLTAANHILLYQNNTPMSEENQQSPISPYSLIFSKIHCHPANR